MMKNLRYADYFFVLILVMSNLLVGYQCANWFDPYDMSIFLDAAYRIWNGQRIYIDFYHNSGPVHLYLFVIFFQLFGFTLQAIMVFLLLSNTLALVIFYKLFKDRISDRYFIWILLIAGFSFYGPISHPWYDQTSWLFFLASFLALEKTFTLDESFKKIILLVSAGVFCALSVLSKTNIGVIGICFLIASYLVNKQRIRFLPFLLLSFAATFFVVIGDPILFYQQTIVSFGMGKRFFLYIKLWDSVYQSPYIHLLLIFLLVFVFRKAFDRKGFDLKAYFKEYFYFFGFLSLGFAATYTGSMVPRSNIAIISVALFYMLLVIKKMNFLKSKSKILSIFCLIYVFSFSSYQAFRMSSWRFRGNLERRWTLSIPGFRGLSCGEYCLGLERTYKYSVENVQENESILVFPGGQVLYGILGKESRKNLPTLFDLAHLSKSEFRDYYYIASQEIQSNPADWIFLYRDKLERFNHKGIVLLMGLHQFLLENYNFKEDFGSYVVFRRKN